MRSSTLGGSTVVGTSNLTITFSEAVQGVSGNEADGPCDTSKTVKLTGSDDSCYGMVIIATNNTYAINPVSDLVTGTYKLTLGAGITDAAGNALSETEISFTVDDALTTAIVNLTKDLANSAGAADVIAAAQAAAGAEGVTNDLNNVLPAAYKAIVELAGFDFDGSLTTVITSLLGNILTMNEAKEQGCDEVIMHNENILTEAGASNLFFVKDGDICTPALSNNILPGITRQILIDTMSDLDIKVYEADFTIDDLKNATAAWLTSSTKGIAPIEEIINLDCNLTQTDDKYLIAKQAFDSKFFSKRSF